MTWTNSDFKWDSNPRPLRYRYSALLTELSKQHESSRVRVRPLMLIGRNARLKYVNSMIISVPTVAIKWWKNEDSNAAISLLEKWPEKIQALNGLRMLALCCTDGLWLEIKDEILRNGLVWEWFLPDNTVSLACVAWLHINMSLAWRDMTCMTLLMKWKLSKAWG